MVYTVEIIYTVDIVAEIADMGYVVYGAYMQKTCDVAEKAILAKKNLQKKCVNRDKM